MIGIKNAQISIRVCRGCNQFYIPTGVQQKYCLLCGPYNSKLRQKIFHENYRNKNRLRIVFNSLKSRSKKKKIPFNISLEDINVPEICPILDIKLERNLGKFGSKDTSPSVDRIDPKKGYIKGNIQVISQRANVMKNDASIEELRKFANWVFKTYPE